MANNTKKNLPLELDFDRQKKMMKLGMKLRKVQDEVNRLVDNINRLALEPWQVDANGLPKDGDPPVIRLEKYVVIENDPCQIILDFLNDTCEGYEWYEPEKIEAWLKSQKSMSSGGK